MIATTKDLNGRKFNVKGNVLKVFTKFLQDGKATIQLKEPAFDIRLSKVDPHQLKVGRKAFASDSCVGGLREL